MNEELMEQVIGVLRIPIKWNGNEPVVWMLDRFDARLQAEALAAAGLLTVVDREACSECGGWDPDGDLIGCVHCDGTGYEPAAEQGDSDAR